MEATILAFGTFWFWSLLSVFLLLMLVFVEWESWWAATLSFFVTLCALDYWGDIPVWETIRQNPLVLMAFLIAYGALGTGWALAKWKLFVDKSLRRFEQMKQIGQVPRYTLDAMYKTPEAYLTIPDADNGCLVHIRPKVRNFKNRILFWLTFWPWSLLWTVVNDPVKRLFEKIYESVAGILQRIADNAWKDAGSN